MSKEDNTNSENNQIKQEIQKEFKAVFGQEDENNDLQNAQRKQNDFVDFFKEGQKKTIYFRGKVYKEPQTKEQKIQLREQSINQLQNEMQKERYDLQEFNSKNGNTREESYNNTNDVTQYKQSISSLLDSKSFNQIKKKNCQDFFHQKIVNPCHLSTTQKIDKFINEQPDFSKTSVTVPINQIIHQRNMDDPQYKQHHAFIQKRNLDMTNKSTNSQSFQQKNISSTNSNDINNYSSLSSFGENQNKSKSTYLFSGAPRFWRDKNSNKTGCSEYNQIVGDSTLRSHNTRYYSQLLEQPKLNMELQFLKNLNGEHKEYYKNQDRVQAVVQSTKLPSQQQQEYQQTKEQLENHKQWKRQFTYGLKQQNILKNTYRSGIVSMDSPYADGTQIYKDTKEKINYQQQRQILNQQKREQYLNKFTASHPDISFQNTYGQEKNKHLIQNNVINSRYNQLKDQQSHSFPHQSHQISYDWASKKQGQNIPQKLPTFQNCFGHNLEDQKQKITNPRSMHLREQDLKGKNFNPLTGVNITPIC